MSGEKMVCRMKIGKTNPTPGAVGWGMKVLRKVGEVLRYTKVGMGERKKEKENRGSTEVKVR
jgi:hypothetical protein